MKIDRKPPTVLCPDELHRIARMAENMIYLDNAATTFPKPESVMRRMVDITSPWAYRQVGQLRPGMGGAGRCLDETKDRKLLWRE